MERYFNILLDIGSGCDKMVVRWLRKDAQPKKGRKNSMTTIQMMEARKAAFLKAAQTMDNKIQEELFEGVSKGKIPITSLMATGFVKRWAHFGNNVDTKTNTGLPAHLKVYLLLYYCYHRPNKVFWTSDIPARNHRTNVNELTALAKTHEMFPFKTEYQIKQSINLGLQHIKNYSGAINCPEHHLNPPCWYDPKHLKYHKWKELEGSLWKKIGGSFQQEFSYYRNSGAKLLWENLPKSITGGETFKEAQEGRRTRYQKEDGYHSGGWCSWTYRHSDYLLGKLQELSPTGEIDYFLEEYGLINKEDELKEAA